jgi:hypothetical protein
MGKMKETKEAKGIFPILAGFVAENLRYIRLLENYLSGHTCNLIPIQGYNCVKMCDNSLTIS